MHSSQFLSPVLAAMFLFTATGCTNETPTEGKAPSEQQASVKQAPKEETTTNKDVARYKEALADRKDCILRYLAAAKAKDQALMQEIASEPKCATADQRLDDAWATARPALVKAYETKAEGMSLEKRAEVLLTGKFICSEKLDPECLSRKTVDGYNDKRQEQVLEKIRQDPEEETRWEQRCSKLAPEVRKVVGECKALAALAEERKKMEQAEKRKRAAAERQAWIDKEARRIAALSMEDRLKLPECHERDWNRDQMCRDAREKAGEIIAATVKDRSDAEKTLSACRALADRLAAKARPELTKAARRTIDNNQFYVARLPECTKAKEILGLKGPSIFSN